MADSFFPKVKKSITDFLYEEEGNIPRNKLLTLGSMILLLSILYADEAFAGHRPIVRTVRMARTVPVLTVARTVHILRMNHIARTSLFRIPRTVRWLHPRITAAPSSPIHRLRGLRRSRLRNRLLPPNLR